ncbi:(Fe-S)-binding protein [Amaricoccus tamworthensis]|uniref:(Fe-S)-binding protein n=1 Tax=Amaricoccus tamworthensis TaxID=57002 RepID=UPI003C79829B
MSAPRVALLVTCLVDMFRPSVGFATVKLLEDAGCTVEVPQRQTCCGQPAWNSGDREHAKALAAQVIEEFEGFDYVVAPSGSCAATVVKDYAEMFKGDEAMVARAKALAAKTHEITSFLTDVLGISDVKQALTTSVTYHDSCSGLRSLGVSEQPRKLLGSVEGLELREMVENDVCCGFGGTFCVKFPDVSNSMVSDKTRNIADTGADMVLAGDLGCLMNMAGKASREGRTFKARHVVEILAGDTKTPAIGEDK